MIKVKKLEWEEETDYGINKICSCRYISYACEYSRYLIHSYADLFFTVQYAGIHFNEDSGDYCVTRYNTLDEAKLAAQAHYDNLILSGIEVANDD